MILWLNYDLKTGGFEETTEKAAKTTEPGIEQVHRSDQRRVDQSRTTEIQSDRGDRDPREGRHREDVPSQWVIQFDFSTLEQEEKAVELYLSRYKIK